MNRETNIKLVSLRSELIGLHHNWRLMKKSGREHLPRDYPDDKIKAVKERLVEEMTSINSIKSKCEEIANELEKEVVDLDNNINE